MSLLIRSNMPLTRSTAANCVCRSATVKVARLSRVRTNGAVETWPALVNRTVYVPGRNRSPKAEEPASDAAGGTCGGLVRIDQLTRLRPRRLEAGTTSTTL